MAAAVPAMASATDGIAVCGPMPDVTAMLPATDYLAQLDAWNACLDRVNAADAAAAAAAQQAAADAKKAADKAAAEAKRQAEAAKLKARKPRHKVVKNWSDAPAISRVEARLDRFIADYYDGDVRGYAFCRGPKTSWTRHGWDHMDAWPKFRYRCSVDFAKGWHSASGSAKVSYDAYRGYWRYDWHKAPWR
jgi:hypothetical protein